MQHKQTRDFLIRNMPIEIYDRLEKSAEGHHRSKNQEAIVAISNGLSISGHEVQKPVPLKWKQKISNQFIDKAIKEGRE
jgi:plasmid stability protein